MQQTTPTTNISYPATYQRQLSPSWLQFAATLCGAALADIDRPFRYLELGCGRGTSALVHAASCPKAEFHAVDRDEAAIVLARAHAKSLGLDNIQFHLVTFEDMSRMDLPLFDFIALHGVYSWVDETQRAILRRLLSDRLAPGGLAYVSYNCMPGWAAELPLRRLFQELSTSRSEDDVGRIQWAADEIARLSSCGLRYFSTYPTAEHAVASWARQDAGYLAHEYLADGWEPLWSVDVIDDMASAGFLHIGSATLYDNHEELLVHSETSRAIARLETGRLRTLALDLAVNRSFRRDLYVRANAVPHEDGRSDAVKQLIVGCPGDVRSIPEALVVPRGRIRFRPEFIAALRARMQVGAWRIGALAIDLGGPDRETIRNLLWLTAAGALVPKPRVNRVSF